MRLKTLKSQVRYCLEYFPPTRNSDIRLMLEVWQQFYPEKIGRIDGKNVVWLQELYELPREDNIKRLRAKIQNVEREFLPTEQSVAVKRGFEVDEWKRELYGNPIGADPRKPPMKDDPRDNWQPSRASEEAKEVSKPQQEEMF